MFRPPRIRAPLPWPGRRRREALAPGSAIGYQHRPMNDAAPTFHDRTVAVTAQTFGVFLESGRTEAKAADELRRVGPNELPRRKPPSAWKVFFAQFLSPLVLTLLAAAGVATVAAVWHADPSLGFLARYSDAIAILIIGYVQERKAERALESLQAMLTFNARVVRGGEERVIPARELVPGDVVVLEAGDHVPADVRLGETADCRADESPLTGESTPVEKDAARVLEAATTLADRSNMAFMGTMVVRGRARAIVVSTGVGTEIGRIGKLIGEISGDPSPLE